MPIRPQPMRVSCPHCHWYTISAPRSDAISPGEWVTQCPRCGHEDLERTPLSSWQASLVRLCERWFVQDEKSGRIFRKR